MTSLPLRSQVFPVDIYWVKRSSGGLFAGTFRLTDEAFHAVRVTSRMDSSNGHHQRRRQRLSEAIKYLLTASDPKGMHRAWLTSDVAMAFNESIYCLYTGLTYHTLPVAALLDNYRAGHEFENLVVAVDDEAGIVPYPTVYAGDRFASRIDGSVGEQPWVRLGSRPWWSWASTWNRLTAHPLDIDSDKENMVLDAKLRRIWS